MKEVFDNVVFRLPNSHINPYPETIKCPFEVLIDSDELEIKYGEDSLVIDREDLEEYWFKFKKIV